MEPLIKTCLTSGQNFTLDEADLVFYNRIEVPSPTLCPDERQRRRLSWRNERNLYHRKCDLCDKQIISIYQSESPYKVYCNACWWSDKWDAAEFGQEIDFSRSFFDQFHELQLKIPRLALYQKNNENCDYTNHTENNRNCYVCIDTAFSENVYFSKWIIRCRDSADCYNIEDGELCYECQYQVKGYQNVYNFFSDFTQFSAFTYGCISCQNCFMCSNLNRKQYCFRNQQLSKEQYEAEMAKIDLKSHSVFEALKREYRDMTQAAPKRAGLVIFSEESEGDCLYQCKKVKDSFDVINSEDCRFCYDAGHLKDCYDVYESAFDCELQYECHGCNRGKFLTVGHVSYDVSDSSYIDSCHNSQNLLGCVGLRHKKYSILNRVYSQEDFKILSEKLIANMKKTGEWGEFFPMSMSPFAYNETLAVQYYPLSEQHVQQAGLKWKAEEQSSVVSTLPICKTCGKNFKVVAAEQAFYQQAGLPAPVACSDCRHKKRASFRNPRALWSRACAQCSVPIQTSYSVERPEKVLCEKCYLAVVY